MEINWNFLGGGGCKTKNLLSGQYGYFLELHNGKRLVWILYIKCMFYCGFISFLKKRCIHGAGTCCGEFCSTNL